MKNSSRPIPTVSIPASKHCVALPRHEGGDPVRTLEEKKKKRTEGGGEKGAFGPERGLRKDRRKTEGRKRRSKT